jgi:hypothetical protein
VTLRARWVTLRARWVTLRASLGDAKSSRGDAESSLVDAKSSRGDAESSLVDAESSLGDAKRVRGCGYLDQRPRRAKMNTYRRYMLLKMVTRLRPEEVERVDKVRAAAARARKQLHAVLRDTPSDDDDDDDDARAAAAEAADSVRRVEAWEATLPAGAPRTSTVGAWLEDELGMVAHAIPRKVSQHQRELLTTERRRELTLRQLREVISRATACERTLPSPLATLPWQPPPRNERQRGERAELLRRSPWAHAPIGCRKLSWRFAAK